MTNIARSILALDANAQVSINAEDLNQIIWHDGNPTNITNQQITDKQAELQVVEDARVAQEVTDKVSGNQKLLDLGLSQAEVDALTG